LARRPFITRPDAAENGATNNMYMLKRAAVAVALGVLMAVPAASAVASAPTSGQKAAFSVLRGAPAKTLSPAAARFVDSRRGSEAGVDGANVYRVAAPHGGHWDVLSGRGEVCIVLEDHEGISSCASNADAHAGQLRVMLITPQNSSAVANSAVDGPATIAGLVPDATQPEFASVGLRRLPTVTGSNGTYEGDAGSGVAAIKRAASHRSSMAPRRVPIRAKVADLHAWYPCYARGAGSYWCYISGSLWGPAGPYQASDVSAIDGNWECANMVERDGSWAGTTFCSNNMGGASHQWNGTARVPWTGPGVAGVTTFGGSDAVWRD
jgi:hypothetical protein